MKTIKPFLLLLFILFSYPSFSQVTQEWVKRYETFVINYYQYTNKLYPLMELDLAGNIYLAGSIYSSPKSDRNADYIVIKYSPGGVLQWTKIYDGANHNDELLAGMKVDDAGNVYITGTSFINTDTLDNFCTIKYNTHGVLQWVNIFDSPGSLGDIAIALDADITGNVCVTGHTYGGEECPAIIQKINPTGTTAWSKSFIMGPAGTRSIDVIFNNAGEIINALAYTPFEMTYFCLYKMNSGGDSIWCVDVDAQLHGGGVLGVICDESDNLYICGNGTPYFENYYVGYAKKISSSGSYLWNSSYGNVAYSHEIKNFCINSAGSVFTTGTLTQNGTKYLSSKFDNGALAWTNLLVYENSSSNTGRSIDADKSSKIYVTGTIYRNNSMYDYFTVKYSEQGDSIWGMHYNHTANSTDNASNVRVDTGYNVYVTGISQNSNGSFSYATIKYNQITGIKPINSEVPMNFSLHQNYPNPFNPSTKIKFSLPLPSKGGAMDVKLVVYDVLGREIATLVNVGLSPGTYEVEWDGSNYPSGVYFYKLITVDASSPLANPLCITKKMVLVK